MPAYSFKRRFVNPIRLGLGLEPIQHHRGYPMVMDDDPPAKPKTHTIRNEGKRRHARPGEEVQLYHAQRSPLCFLIGRARCIETQPIRIDVAKNGLSIGLRGERIQDLDAFAITDGFRDADDMHRFWLKEHGIGFFKQIIIYWAPIT